MSIVIQPQQVQNPQQLEAVVAGPDGANRIFVLDGQINAGIGAFSQGPYSEQHETFILLLGPVLTRQQFYRAIASASITNSGLSTNPAANPTMNESYNWRIINVDADWDDESGQVELRIELAVGVSGSQVSAQISGLGYHLTILAALPV